jgi:hypothetical protein
MAQAHCMLDTLGYNQKLRICNICCFSTATVVARKRLTVVIRSLLISLSSYIDKESSTNLGEERVLLHVVLNE